MPIGFGTLTGQRSFGRGFITSSTQGFAGTLISSGSTSVGVYTPQTSTVSYSNAADQGAWGIKTVGYATSGTTEYFFNVWLASSTVLYYNVVTVTPTSISVGTPVNFASASGNWYFHGVDVAFSPSMGRIIVSTAAQYSYGSFRQRYEYRDNAGWMFNVGTTDGSISLQNGSMTTYYRMYSNGYGYGFHECDSCSPYTTDATVMQIGVDNDDANSRFVTRSYQDVTMVSNTNSGNNFGTNQDYHTQCYRRAVATGPNTTYPVITSIQQTGASAARFVPQTAAGADAGHKISVTCSNAYNALSDVSRGGTSIYLWQVNNRLYLISYNGSTTASEVTYLDLVNDGTTTWVAVNARAKSLASNEGSWVVTLASGGSAGTSSTVHYGTYTASSLTLVGKSTLTSSGATAWATGAWAYNAGAADNNAKMLICGRDSSTGYAEFHALK